MKLRYIAPIPAILLGGSLLVGKTDRIRSFEGIREEVIQTVNTLIEDQDFRLLESHTCAIRTSQNVGALICAIDPGVKRLIAIELYGIGGAQDVFTIEGIRVQNGLLKEETGCLRMKESSHTPEIGEVCSEKIVGESI